MDAPGPNTSIDSLLRTFIIKTGRISSLSDGKAILEGKDFCEFVLLYNQLHQGLNDFTLNRSSTYMAEYNHYFNYEPNPNIPDDGPTSIYLGDAETNFQEKESSNEDEEEEEIEVDESSDITQIDTITDALIAFSPFIILLASMPSVIFLSAVLSNEAKEYTNVLLSMPPDVCKEASNKIQKGIIEGKKSSSITSSQAGSSFPYYIVTLIGSIIVIGIIIGSAIYAQSVHSISTTLISQLTLFMQLRNIYQEVSIYTYFSVVGTQNSIPPGLPFSSGNAQAKSPIITPTLVLNGFNKYTAIANLLQGIIDIGDDNVESALGFRDEIDAVRFTPKCEQEPDTQYALDFYRCLSFDRACAYFMARASEIKVGVSSVKIDSKELYNLGFLVNSKILTGFDELINTYIKVFTSTIRSFQIAITIFAVVCIAVAAISFAIELTVLKSIKEMHRSFQTVSLRINPIHYVQNQMATSFLIGKDSSEESRITSAAHAVFYTSTDAMILLNNEGIIEKLNPAATSIFHFTPEQMLGQHSTIILPKDDPKNKQLYYTMQLMSSGQCGLVFETELQGTRDDDTRVPIKATMIGFASDQRNADVFAIMCKDQTEEVKQKEAVEIAKKKSDDLLLKILPPDIIRRINRGEKDITMVVPSASVIFIDICQFSSYMATLSASQLMCNLNAVFTAYDKIVADLPLITKIKLIGDDYMAAAGLFSPDEPPKMHAIQIITFGLRVLDAIDELNEQLNANLMVRIGVNSGGPIIAGVLGTEKPLFDIIGDTINVASRLQSTDIPGNVQISKGTYELIAAEDRFNIEERGEIYLKGKGNQTTYFVTLKDSKDQKPDDGIKVIPTSHPTEGQQ